MNQPRPLDVFLRIFLATLLIAWCFFIARPFLVILIWAVIIAVAIYPFYNKVLKLLGGRRGLAVGLFLLLFLGLIALPSFGIAQSLVKHSREIKALISDPDVQVPPPSDAVADWPIVGNKIYGLWSEASRGLQSFITEHSEQATKIVGWLLKGFASVFTDAALSLVSLFISGFLLYHSKSAFEGIRKFSVRLIGDKGIEFVLTARSTIRSVVQGILLIALIQSIAAFAGFKMVGLNAAPVLAVLVLILATIQMPVFLITVPAAIYVFSIADTTTAVIFAIYMVVIGLLDNLLKPLLLGRGLEVPMIVILIGSLGGLVLHGILGLFVGPVVLAIGYQAYELWLHADPDLEKKIELEDKPS